MVGRAGVAQSVRASWRSLRGQPSEVPRTVRSSASPVWLSVSRVSFAWASSSITTRVGPLRTLLDHDHTIRRGGESSRTSHSTYPRNPGDGGSRRMKRAPTLASKPSTAISQRAIICGSVRACQTRSIGTGNSSSIEISSFTLISEQLTKSAQPAPPELGVTTRPVMNLLQRGQVKLIEPLPSRRLTADQSRAAQDRQVLRSRKT
jgi:hypothetical protein